MEMGLSTHGEDKRKNCSEELKSAGDFAGRSAYQSIIIQLRALTCESFSVIQKAYQ
jgi:hypothetical protein